MDDELYETIVTLLTLMILSLLQRSRSTYINPLLVDRSSHGFFNSVIPILIKNEGLNLNYNLTEYIRMDSERFKYLLGFTANDLAPRGPCRLDAIQPAMKLMITLRFLAGGETFQTLALCFRLGHSTVSVVVQQTCNAIIQKVGPKYLTTPDTVEEWRKVQDRFFRDWNFPRVVGCVDGKHIAIEKPSNSGSEFLNYKS